MHSHSSFFDFIKRSKSTSSDNFLKEVDIGRFEMLIHVCHCFRNLNCIWNIFCRLLIVRVLNDVFI